MNKVSPRTPQPLVNPSSEEKRVSNRDSNDSNSPSSMVRWLRAGWHYFQSPLANVFGPLALLLFVVFSIAIIRETFRDVAVIRPIAVPRALADKGYTPEVVSQRLLDQIELINRRNEIVGRAFLKKPKLFHAELSEMDMQLPGLGLSFRSALSYLRSLVGNGEVNVSGEIVQPDEKTFILRLRISTDEDRYSDVAVDSAAMASGASASPLDVLMSNGALETVRLLDPYALAIYYLDKDQSQAPGVIQYCEEYEPRCKPWAAVLWGLIYKDHKQTGEAIVSFRQALQEFGPSANAWPAYGIADMYLADLLRGRSNRAGRQSDGADYAEAMQIYQSVFRLFQHHGRMGRPGIGTTTDDPYDQFYIGHFYETGLAFDRANCNTAAIWYRRAAERGEAHAQNSLGDFYAQFDKKDCDDLPARNYTTALYWYQLAALNDQVYAQRHLGEMYRDGLGLAGAPGIESAVRWLQKAAKNGDLRARMDLAQIYEEGLGVPQDLIRAYAWFDLACQAQGAAQEEASHARDKAARKLKPEELMTAKKLAQEWSLGHLSDL